MTTQLERAIEQHTKAEHARFDAMQGALDPKDPRLKAAAERRSLVAVGPGHSIGVVTLRKGKTSSFAELSEADAIATAAALNPDQLIEAESLEDGREPRRPAVLEALLQRRAALAETQP